MGKYKKLISNTALLALGTFGSKFLVFFMMPLYTACLLPAEYSMADLITQVANLLIPLACAGISDGVFRFALDESEDKKTVFSSGLCVLSITSLVFLALSPFLLFYQTLSTYVWLVILYVIFANIHSVVAQYIRALGRTGLFALGGIIGTMLTIGFNLVFLLGFDMGILGYVLSVVLGDVIVTGILLLVSGVYRDFDRHSIRRDKIGQMLRYSVPMIPTTIFWWITSVSDRQLVIAFRGSEVNGLYAAAYKAPTLLTLLCTVFIEAWQFSAVRETSEEERSEFFTRVFAYFQGLMFMAASGLVLFSKFITRILLAENYFDAWQYLPVLSLAMVYSGLVTFMGSVYMVRKKSVHSLVTAAVGAGTNILLNILLIPKYSAMGAAVATFASYFVVMILRSADALRMVKFKLGVPRLVFNTLILGAQCFIMVMEVPQWKWFSLACFAAVLVVNGANIYAGIRGMLGGLKKRKKV